MTSHGPEKLTFTQPAQAALTQRPQDSSAALTKHNQAHVDNAILTALKLFSGIYANRFQPNDATVAAWAIALEGLSPQEIAAAAKMHVRNTSRRDDGSCVGSWPPTPADILADAYAKRTLSKGSHRYV